MADHHHELHGVYDYEAFARNNKFIWLDCRHLYGTDGYCDRMVLWL